MMNQDQYHASLLNKGKVGLGWDGVTKASQPKALPFEPPNTTDPEQSILKVYDDDCKTIELCFNEPTSGEKCVRNWPKKANEAAGRIGPARAQVSK